MPFTRLLFGTLAILLAAGCATRPVNEPIVRVDPDRGYRPYLRIPKQQNNDPKTLFVLSFSGGGTRAAALSYGVLEQLRRTEVVVDGARRRLLDEVDLVTGVSGGSFTALAYALYGERLFTEYEHRFLKRDVQGALILRAINPVYWPRYIGGTAGRSELAADFYDEILFDGATFGDLIDKPTPTAIATGTDLSTGSRLAFYQNDFDLLCSNLSTLRLSRAAATSSAVPAVLSPITLNNYGGTCGYQFPPWAQRLADAPDRARPFGSVTQRYREMVDFQNSKERPYIHLVDGGVSDNLGLRGVLETLMEFTLSEQFRAQMGFGVIRRIALVVVNAHSSPRTNWDRIESPPGIVLQLLQASGVPIDRYSTDTVQLMRDSIAIAQLNRALAIERMIRAGSTPAQAQAAVPGIQFHVVDLSFDAIDDPKERQYFMDLPTSFALTDGQVDRLRAIAGRLMGESLEYAAFVRDLTGAGAPAGGLPASDAVRGVARPGGTD